MGKVTITQKKIIQTLQEFEVKIVPDKKIRRLYADGLKKLYIGSKRVTGNIRAMLNGDNSNIIYGLYAPDEMTLYLNVKANLKRRVKFLAHEVIHEIYDEEGIIIPDPAIDILARQILKDSKIYGILSLYV